jgi:nucleoside-diphosphate-sugar epimerase
MTTSHTPDARDTSDPGPQGAEGLHVILGTGPVGCWTARALAHRGVAVRAVNRSGRHPALMPEAVEVVAADATDRDAIIAASAGAAVVYQALNPEYHRWHDLFQGLQAAALAAARATGARYVSIENLYMYDSSATMTEDSPIAPRSRKGALRQEMAQEVVGAHAAGEVQAAQLRSSDYFGPGVRDSAMGEMVFGRLLAGKSAQVAGSTSQAHSFAYVPDVGRAAAALGLDPGTAGRVWLAPHGPATTQGEMVTRAAGLMGVTPRTSVASPAMMRLIGLFSPGARETVEMMYEFTAPFVVDSRRITDELGLEPTPLGEALAATVAWYREQA